MKRIMNLFKIDYSKLNIILFFLVFNFFIILLLHLIYGTPFLEHSFRQHQTLLLIKGYIDDQSISILSSPLYLFGNPWSLPLEFPLFQFIVAKISIYTGVNYQLISKLLNIIFTCFNVFLIGYLGKNIFNLNQKVLLIFALSSPVLLLYSGSYMIENFSILLVLFSLFFYNSESRNIKLLFPIFVSLAAVVKVTTLFLTFPIFIYLFYKNIIRKNFLFIVFTIFSFLICVSIFYSWITFSNDVKESNVLSSFLSTNNPSFRKWNHGIIFSSIYDLVLGFLRYLIYSGIAPFLLPIIIIKQSFKIKMAIFILIFLPFLFFFNLFYTHSYYSLEYIFPLAIIIGFIYKKSNNIILYSLLNLVIFWVLLFPKFLNNNNYDDSLIEYQNLISKSDNKVFLVYGLSWDPTFAFISDSKLIFIRGHKIDIDNLKNLALPFEVGGYINCHKDKNKANHLISYFNNFSISDTHAFNYFNKQCQFRSFNY